jgi:hypothetical protein
MSAGYSEQDILDRDERIEELERELATLRAGLKGDGTTIDGLKRGKWVAGRTVGLVRRVASRTIAVTSSDHNPVEAVLRLALPSTDIATDFQACH